MRLYSAVIYLFVCTALAVTNFINPPANGTLNDFRDNPVYRLGDRINIQWESDRQGVTISVIFPYLNPRNDIGAFKGIDLRITDNTTYKWTINLDGLPGALEALDTKGTAILYFQMYPPEGGFLAQSHYFNVTYPDGSAPSAATSARPTMTQTSANSSPTGPTKGLEAAVSNGPSQAAFIGGVIGAMFVGLIIGIAGVFLWQRFRGSGSKTKPVQEDTHYNISPVWHEAPVPIPAPPPVEASGNGRAEVEGTEKKLR